MGYDTRSMRSRMSSTFQAVVRGPSFTGLGKRPDLTPAHHVERPTGIGPRGARMEGRRTKPNPGRLSCDFMRFGHPLLDGTVSFQANKSRKAASEKHPTKAENPTRKRQKINRPELLSSPSSP